MNIQQAILKAQQEGKEIALPTNERCENGGYQIRLKPFPNNMVIHEFYGRELFCNQFPLPLSEMVRDDWIVVDQQSAKEMTNL